MEGCGEGISSRSNFCIFCCEAVIYSHIRINICIKIPSAVFFLDMIVTKSFI